MSSFGYEVSQLAQTNELPVLADVNAVGAEVYEFLRCPVRTECSPWSALLAKVASHSSQMRTISVGKCPIAFECSLALFLLGKTCEQTLHLAGEGL